MFMVSRGTACMAYTMRQRVLAALAADGLIPGQGMKSKNGKFGWVMKWGYGSSAYLIDFLDPVFQKDTIAAFKKLYDETMAVSPDDTAEYKDPFDIKKLLSQENSHTKTKIDLKQLNKNYDPSIHLLSANAVQLHEVMKKWNWFIDASNQDYAVDFIMKYDINGDGRLNARELILGTITHNKNAIGSGICTNCFQEVAKKLDALFIFLDCNNDGYLSAEDMWNNLPKLSRGDNRWNIFAFSNSDNIRTSALNDFCMKNGRAKEGGITKDEFRTGVLYAYWDRQTRNTGVIEDDSRNLKYLRWMDNDSIDTVAFNYMKEKVLAELMAKSNK